MCNHPASKGFRWMAGCNIPTICLSKRLGSRRAEDEEQCYAKCDKAVFHQNLVNSASCIYHKSALEFKILETCLQKAYVWGQSNLVLQTEVNFVEPEKVNAPILSQHCEMGLTCLVGPQSSESVDCGPSTLNRLEGVLGVQFVTQLKGYSNFGLVNFFVWGVTHSGGGETAVLLPHWKDLKHPTVQ